MKKRAKKNTFALVLIFLLILLILLVFLSLRFETTGSVTSSASTIKAFFNFNEGNGTQAYDKSGNNYYLYTRSTNWVPGQNISNPYDYALDFNTRMDSYPYIPYLSPKSQLMTISIIVKPNKVGIKQLILCYPISCAQFIIMNADGSFGYSQAFAGIGFGDYKARNGDWVNLVVTYNGTTAKTYVNGILKEAKNIGAVNWNGVQSTSIGSGQIPSWLVTNRWSGGIDDLLIYENKVLNDVEIKQLASYYFPGSIPQCSDGIDNDNDGKIDLVDPECNNLPSHNSEKLNPYKKTSIKVNGISYSDYCDDYNRVVEYSVGELTTYSSGIDIRSSVAVENYFSCSEGCVKGEGKGLCKGINNLQGEYEEHGEAI